MKEGLPVSYQDRILSEIHLNQLLLQNYAF